MSKILIDVEEVMEITGLSKVTSYKLIREVNSELKKLGYTTYRGKTNRVFLLKKLGDTNASI